jgi:hypothetical protein
MKATLLKNRKRWSRTALLGLILLLGLSGCRKPPEPNFVDTLPCSQANGYTWIARSNSDDTGKVALTQTYRDDETYELLGASGVLENAFVGVTPGVATMRLYYARPDLWSGLNSDADGTAYYEFLVYDDLTISLLYSEVEFPESF